MLIWITQSLDVFINSFKVCIIAGNGCLGNIKTMFFVNLNIIIIIHVVFIVIVILFLESGA